MYYVTIKNIRDNDEQVIYYPSDPEAVITNTQLHQVIGECGEFTFNVPAQNPYYGMIQEFNVVTIYRDRKEFWRGFITEINSDFNNTKEVYCVEDLAWLAYETVPATDTSGIRYDAFNVILDFYNFLNEGVKDKQFEVGIKDEGVAMQTFQYTTEYDTSVLDALRTIISSQCYLRVRRTDGHRYLDMVKLINYGNQASQTINLGENILDYVKELDSSNVLSVIYPYGKELDEEEYDGYNKRVKGDALVDATAENKYGRIAKTIFFDTDDVDELNKEAEKYISENSKPHITFEISAVDMAEISLDYKNMDIGDKVIVIAEPFGLTGKDVFPVIEKTIDIQDPSNGVFVLSDTLATRKTLTDIQGEVVEQIEGKKTDSAILAEARKNALKLLDNTEGGYVSFEFNEDDQMIAIHIADNPDIDMATKEWVWNNGGLGFRTREEVGKDAEWTDVAVAMTMDGAIVANAITSGVMSADRVRGGVLEVGGTGFGKEGSIVIKNEENLPIMTFNKDGMTLTNGMKIKWDWIDNNKPTKVSDFPDSGYYAKLEDLKESIVGQNVIYYYQEIKKGSEYKKPKAPSKWVNNKSDVVGAWTTTIPTFQKGTSKVRYAYWKCTQWQSREDKKNETVQNSEVFEYVPNAVTTQITQDTVTTAYVNALGVTAANISAVNIQGKKFYYNNNNYIQFKDNNNRWLQFMSSNNAFTVIDKQGRIYADRLHLATNVECQPTHIFVQMDQGNFSIYGTGTDWATVVRNIHSGSDRRIKNRIESVDVEESWKFIDAAEPSKFHFNEYVGDDSLCYGVIAQELVENLEENGINTEHLNLVYKNDEGFYKVIYKDFIPHLINVAKEQRQEINELKSEVAKLKDLINTLIKERGDK